MRSCLGGCGRFSQRCEAQTFTTQSTGVFNHRWISVLLSKYMATQIYFILWVHPGTILKQTLSFGLGFHRFLLLLPLLWRNGFLDRKSMYLFHLLLKCSIHQPVPLQQPLPFELLRHNLYHKTGTAPDNSMRTIQDESKVKICRRQETGSKYQQITCCQMKWLPSRCVSHFLQEGENSGKY